MRVFPVLLTAFIILVACGGSTLPATGVSLCKYVGSVRCTGGGTSMLAMERQLTGAGVRVRMSFCEADGNACLAMCGAADGQIGVFEVPAFQAQAAMAVGKPADQR